MFAIRKDKDKKPMIRWVDFMQSLRALRPADLKHFEKEIYRLLDVKANREQVDFDEFVALVGLNKDCSAEHRACLHAHTSDPAN